MSSGTLGKNVQDFRQAALVVLGDELDRGLVFDVLHLARMIRGVPAFFQDEEAGGIVLDRLYVTGDDYVTTYD